MILDAKFQEVGEIYADFGAFMRGEKGEKGDKGDKGDKGEDANADLFANAVVGYAEGESVRVDDVSPVEHIVNVKVDHTDPTSVKVVKCEKNFWQNKDVTFPKTFSGVTVDYDPDTQIYTFNGTSTAPADVYTVPNGTNIMHIKTGETWTLRFEVVSGSVDNESSIFGKMAPVIDTVGYANAIHTNTKSGYVTKTYDKPADVTKMYFYIYSSGIVFDNFKCRVQFELSDKPTEFEKFKEAKTYTPNADGTVDGITSLSPTMTLLTDTEGAVIHCEYNRDTNKVLSSLPSSGGATVTADGTVVSQNADFGEVAEWGDGNPNNEDRTGYFVCADVPVNGIVMKKATSTDDVKGVTILAPAFAGNYSKDKLDGNGNLLPKYSYVAIIGFVPVRDNGTCTVGGRCMPDDNGCAVPSSNSMGYQVVNRIDDNRVLIIIEPNGDMVQRIKTKVVELQKDIGDIETALDNIIAIQEELIGGDA